MRFALFLLSYALNPIIILSIPSESSKTFLLIYTVASAIFSLIFYWAFIIEYSVQYLKQSIVVASLLAIILLTLFPDMVLWVFYPFAILLGDYVTTQTGSSKISNSYRIMMIATAAPFIFMNDWFSTLILMRSILSISFAIAVTISVTSFIPLKVKRSLRYLLVCYVFFSGSLLLLTYTTADPNSLKVWYVAMQIGLGLLLKRLDFSLRAVNIDYKGIFVLINIVVFTLPLLITTYYPNFFNLLIYTMSVLAFMWLLRQERAEQK